MKQAQAYQPLPDAGVAASEWALDVLFEARKSDAWITAVQDPDEEAHWRGGRYAVLNSILKTATGSGHYINQVLFADGCKRSDDNAEAGLFVAFDDVGDPKTNPRAKMDKGWLDLVGPTPTLMVETSEANYQYFYALDEPAPIPLFRGLIRALKTNGETAGGFRDASGVGRYLRLPSGMNPKPGRGGFVTRLVEGAGVKYGLQELADAFRLGVIRPIDRPEPREHDGDDVADPCPIEEIEALLLGPDAPLRNDERFDDRDVYVAIVHHVKGASASSEEGLQIVNAWGAMHHQDPIDDPERRWDSVHSPRTGASALWSKAFRLGGHEATALWFKRHPESPESKALGAPSATKPRFRTLKEFIDEYKPVADVIDGLVSAGSLYTMTGITGTGKTGWLSTAGLSVITGRADILKRKVMQGRVAFSTAENPDGLKMRLAVSAHYFNVDPEATDRGMMISDIRTSPEAIYEDLKRDAEAHGPFVLVFIDTWQAFFDGKDSSNPTDALAFTIRFRPLTRLPGGPAVIMATHPVKRAAADDLIPYGGGLILNEVDGNLTLFRQVSGFIAMHWQGKLRGLEFEPVLYQIENRTCPTIVNIEGKPVQIPVMSPVSQAEAEAREDAGLNRDTHVLQTLADNPQASERGMALVTNMHRNTVKRALAQMARSKPALTRLELGQWVVTKAGYAALNRKSKSE